MNKLLILLAAIGGGAWWYLKTPQPPKGENTPTPLPPKGEQSVTPKVSSSPPSGAGGAGAGVVITDFDTAYDYKLEAGRWYTKRKPTEVWVDMANRLSVANYNLAVVRLLDFMKRR